jgi:hypothetical protein
VQSVDFSGLEKFNKELNDLLNQIPGTRRKLHEDIAVMVKKEVDLSIQASGINDSTGKIREWQHKYVGSGGGYAAVRAIDRSTGNNSPGAITNYLESGHKIRTPSGKAKRYKPRIKTPYVSGRHFYQKARVIAEAQAITLAEKYAEDLARRIEGGSK